MQNHENYMSRALELAKQAFGQTSPNPMVGAVIVKNGKIIGEGYHKKAGTAHAEVNAIADAGADAKDADIYVTLEPCSTYGRTPPCTKAIINAGIKRVFIGSLDPNPDHAGRAVKILNEAGLEVQSGFLQSECIQLNEHFFHWITTGKPFVILKMAMTLDGKIATKSGQSQWITSPASRGFVQQLRQLSDAILVGGSTVREDNPSLIVREPENWPCQPKRIILSHNFTFDKSLNIFNGQKPIFFNPQNQSWTDFLLDLGKQQITCLLVEGGGEVAAELLKHKVIDKVHFMIAPKILGGRDSRTVVGGESPQYLAEAADLKQTSIAQFGVDFMISGYL